MEKPYWEGKEYSYFSHKKCEFFPCHKNADPDDFNCLFCYCPLYAPVSYTHLTLPTIA